MTGWEAWTIATGLFLAWALFRLRKTASGWVLVIPGQPLPVVLALTVVFGIVATPVLTPALKELGITMDQTQAERLAPLWTRPIFRMDDWPAWSARSASRIGKASDHKMRGGLR